MDVRATVVTAKIAPPLSIDRIRAAGAELRLTEDMGAAFALLDELVAEGMTLVHPFELPTQWSPARERWASSRRGRTAADRRPR